MVGDAEVPDAAAAHEVGHGVNDLLQRRRMVFLVQIKDVDGLDAEPAEAGLHRDEGVAARQPSGVRPVAGGVGELGRQHPPIALRLDRAPGDALALAAGVDVGGVDEVDAALSRAVDDARGVGLGGGAAEHHGAEAKRRYPQPRAAERAVVDRPGHGVLRDGSGSWRAGPVADREGGPYSAAPGRLQCPARCRTPHWE